MDFHYAIWWDLIWLYAAPNVRVTICDFSHTLIHSGYVWYGSFVTLLRQAYNKNKFEKCLKEDRKSKLISLGPDAFKRKHD